MPNFDSFETYSFLHPVGISILVGVLACSAWLSAIARSWRGWTTYAVLTFLVMFPLLFLVLNFFVINPPGGRSGESLGVGLVVFFVAGPLALAWLLGLPLGLLFRLGRAAVPMCLVLAMMVPAACSDAALTRLEAAQLACTVTMQALYTPVSDKEPVTFERVANVAADREKFEFVWKQSQVKNLLFHLTMQQIVEAGGAARDDGPRDVVIVFEAAGGEREYVCRGSLSARTMHGVWVRQRPASASIREIKVTKSPIDF